jgi:hypothetical protein
MVIVNQFFVEPEGEPNQSIISKGALMLADHLFLIVDDGSFSKSSIL